VAERPALDPARLGLAALLLAALWATARTRALPLVWILALPMLIALGLPQRHPPLVLLRALAHAVWIVCGLMFACAAAWVLYPLISDTLIARVGLGAGVLLLVLASCLCFGTDLVPASRGVLPATLGALLAAALDPRASLAGPLLLGVLAVVVLLGAGAPGGIDLPLVATLIVAAGLMLGCMRLLPWAQPYVEERLASAVNGAATNAVTGFGTSASLGDVAALGLSRRPALRVYGVRAPKLRGRVFTRFTGRGWELEPGPASVATPLADGAPAHWPTLAPGVWRVAPGSDAHDLAEADLLLTVVPVLDEAQLFVPAHVVAARVASPRLEWSPSGILRAEPSAAAYDIVARDSSRGSLSEDLRAACMQLPPRLDPRLEALAHTLASGAATPQARVARTLAHLDRTCRYSLEPGSFVTADPLAEFLFQKQSGYCEYFATAAAVLLRLQGLPTRYVKGFNASATARDGDHDLIRESDAHAWIDVYVPGTGWVETDPTPAADYAEVHGAADAGLTAVWERIAAWCALLRLRLTGDRMLRWGLLTALVLGLVLSMGPRMLARLRLGPSQVPTVGGRGPATLRPELRVLVRRFDQQCAARGLARPAARGLLEHLEHLDGPRFGPAWKGTGRAVAECVYAEVYAGQMASAQRMRELSAALRHD
jgi:transglutaminase-like putative cysteine protease